MTHILFPDVCFLKLQVECIFCYGTHFIKVLTAFGYVKYYCIGVVSLLRQLTVETKYVNIDTQCIKFLVAQAQKAETISKFLAVTAAAKLLQSCPALYDPMDHSLPGTSVCGILQARILEQIAMPCSRDQTCTSYLSCVGRQVLYHQRHLVLYYLMRQKLMIKGYKSRKIIYSSAVNTLLSIVSFRVKARFLQRPLKTPPFFPLPTPFSPWYPSVFRTTSVSQSLLCLLTGELFCQTLAHFASSYSLTVVSKFSSL